MKPEITIPITEYPSGQKAYGQYITLYDDGSVEGMYFYKGSPLRSATRKVHTLTLQFCWGDHSKAAGSDTAGCFELSFHKFSCWFGCGYSGSSYSQEIPSELRTSVLNWMHKHHLQKEYKPIPEGWRELKDDETPDVGDGVYSRLNGIIVATLSYRLTSPIPDNSISSVAFIRKIK